MTQKPVTSVVEVAPLHDRASRGVSMCQLHMAVAQLRRQPPPLNQQHVAPKTPLHHSQPLPRLHPGHAAHRRQPQAGQTRLATASRVVMAPPAHQPRRPPCSVATEQRKEPSRTSTPGVNRRRRRSRLPTNLGPHPPDPASPEPPAPPQAGGESHGTSCGRAAKGLAPNVRTPTPLHTALERARRAELLQAAPHADPPPGTPDPSPPGSHHRHDRSWRVGDGGRRTPGPTRGAPPPPSLQAHRSTLLRRRQGGEKAREGWRRRRAGGATRITP
ncbi:hypothetical protein PVAP13_9KG319357 [Panicum virgatum]|uniref:Uncharacterized protein n=1 Tax=Panicum virgatum TaxID=38727 RepID=A0A8T0NN11_PANVG|nr:hypothetical protein PVAP13_9KG319357 [Panicum virgatum]